MVQKYSIIPSQLVINLLVLVPIELLVCSQWLIAYSNFHFMFAGDTCMVTHNFFGNKKLQSPVPLRINYFQSLSSD